MGTGSDAAGTIGAAAAAAGTGAAGEGREPRLSKPDSRRSFCTGAGAMAGVKAGAAAVGARVGDMRPERWKCVTGKTDLCTLCIYTGAVHVPTLPLYISNKIYSIHKITFVP